MNANEYKGIWVFAEQEEGKLSSTPLELLNKAHDLKAKLGNKDTVTAVLLGKSVEHLAKTLFEHGAEQVLLLENNELETYKHRTYTEALSKLSEKYKPSIFLFAASPLGRELAPRIMARLDTGLTADAIDLDVDEDGTFVQTTPNYGGSILSHIAIPERRPQMVTVHPKVFTPMEAKPNTEGVLIRESVEIEADNAFEILETVYKPATTKPITDAKVLVSGGRGIKKPEDLDMLKELADLLGGQLACSRPLTDNGWLGHEYQIGQSGANVKPDLIINVAVSGSVQYVAGMQKSKCIMSVNHTADAPIYDVTHFGAVSDYRKFIPALINELKRRKA